MTDYQYIEALFKAVLDKSKAVQGRFFVTARYGMQEVNYDELGQPIKDYIERLEKKYPLSMMPQPVSYVHISGRNDGWETYRIMIFFVDQIVKPENINPRTRTNTKSVAQVQTEMKRVAMNFLRTLQKVGSKPPVRFSVSDNQMFISPVNRVGLDGVCGVKVDFDLKMQIQCDYTDYDENVEIVISN